MQSNITKLSLDSSCDLSSPSNRELIKRQLESLDQRMLSEDELRQYFDVFKMLMQAFIQKVTTLESCIEQIQREQKLAEQRTENVYLQSQLEIQSLRSELKQQRLSKKRFTQILSVAETLKGNPYAPYAIKGLIEPTLSAEACAELPKDFSQRLDFAKQLGFRWNQNNRPPHKKVKQLQLLEKWEDEFCSVENLPLQVLLSTQKIRSMGPGAIAGALIALERHLGYEIPDKATLSSHNAYLKAVKLCKEIPPPTLDYAKVAGLFSQKDQALILQKLSNTNPLYKPEDCLRFIKRVSTTELMPTICKSTADLYSLQAGAYDQTILRVFN